MRRQTERVLILAALIGFAMTGSAVAAEPPSMPDRTTIMWMMWPVYVMPAIFLAIAIWRTWAALRIILKIVGSFALVVMGIAKKPGRSDAESGIKPLAERETDPAPPLTEARARPAGRIVRQVGGSSGIIAGSSMSAQPQASQPQAPGEADVLERPPVRSRRPGRLSEARRDNSEGFGRRAVRPSG